MIDLVEKGNCCGTQASYEPEQCFPPCAHNHDSRYYTKIAIDNLLANLEGNGGNIYFGNDVPLDSFGRDEDVYFVVIANNPVYKRLAGTWQLQGYLHEDVDLSNYYTKGEVDNIIAILPNPDWNATTGHGLILNKPTNLSQFVNDLPNPDLSAYIKQDEFNEVFGDFSLDTRSNRLTIDNNTGLFNVTSLSGEDGNMEIGYFGITTYKTGDWASYNPDRIVGSSNRDGVGGSWSVDLPSGNSNLGFPKSGNYNITKRFLSTSVNGVFADENGNITIPTGGDTSNFLRKDIDNTLPNDRPSLIINSVYNSGGGGDKDIKLTLSGRGIYGETLSTNNGHELVLNPNYVGGTSFDINGQISENYTLDTSGFEVQNQDGLKGSLYLNLDPISTTNKNSELVFPFTTDKRFVTTSVNGVFANENGDVVLEIPDLSGYVRKNGINTVGDTNPFGLHTSGLEMELTQTDFRLIDRDLNNNQILIDPTQGSLTMLSRNDSKLELDKQHIRWFHADGGYSRLRQADAGFLSELKFPNSDRPVNIIPISVNGVFSDTSGNITIPSGSVELGSGLHEDTDGKINLGRIDNDGEEGLLTRATTLMLIDESFPNFNSSLTFDYRSLNLVHSTDEDNLGVYIDSNGLHLSRLNRAQDLLQDLTFKNSTNGSSIVLTDEINNKGIVYAADYSANFTDHSLVTKKFVLDNAGGTTPTLEEVLTAGSFAEHTGRTSIWNYYPGGTTKYSQIDMQGDSLTLLQFNAAGEGQSISMSDSQIAKGIGISDEITSVGLMYFADYSVEGKNHDRWVPDWKTVKNYVVENTNDFVSKSKVNIVTSPFSLENNRLATTLGSSDYWTMRGKTVQTNLSVELGINGIVFVDSNSGSTGVDRSRFFSGGLEWAIGGFTYRGNLFIPTSGDSYTKLPLGGASNDSKVLTTSVNGIFADANGNIVVPTGGSLQSVTTGTGNNVTSNAIQVTGADETDVTVNSLLLFHDETAGSILGRVKDGNIIGQLQIAETELQLRSGLSSLNLQVETAIKAGAEFATRVKGSNAQNSDEFVTKAQLDAASGGGSTVGFGIGKSNTDALTLGKSPANDGEYEVNLQNAEGLAFKTDNYGYLRMSKYGGFTMTGDLTFTAINKGVVMQSPDGSSWKLTVANDGSLTTTKL